MFSSMVDTLTIAGVLSALVMLVALLAEGRGRHAVRVLLGLRTRATLEQVMTEVPRNESDWDLLEHVNSRPDRAAPAERAAAWVSDTTSKATQAVVERARVLSQPQDQAEAPRTGELGLAQR